MDVERTRSELVPYLEEYLDNSFLHDEVLLTLAEQLETFVPFVGGPEHVNCIFRLLEKICITDETVARERAVESLVKIASNLDGSLLEKNFVPLIQKLANDTWFTSKCSATGLFAVSCQQSPRGFVLLRFSGVLPESVSRTPGRAKKLVLLAAPRRPALG